MLSPVFEGEIVVVTIYPGERRRYDRDHEAGQVHDSRWLLQETIIVIDNHL